MTSISLRYIKRGTSIRHMDNIGVDIHVITINITMDNNITCNNNVDKGSVNPLYGIHLTCSYRWVLLTQHH